MTERAIVQYSQAARILVPDHSGELWVCYYVELQIDVVDDVAGISVPCGMVHTAVFIKG